MSKLIIKLYVFLVVGQMLYIAIPEANAFYLALYFTSFMLAGAYIKEYGVKNGMGLVLVSFLFVAFVAPLTISDELILSGYSSALIMMQNFTFMAVLGASLYLCLLVAKNHFKVIS